MSNKNDSYSQLGLLLGISKTPNEKPVGTGNQSEPEKFPVEENQPSLMADLLVACAFQKKQIKEYK